MRKRVGTVYVDAGIIWVGDPCYIMGDDASNRVTSWSDFCEKITDHKQVSEPLGTGVGLVVSSGFGDGAYPVYAELSDEGDWGVRVKSVTIEFMEETDE